jgi:hypothetical protein
MAKQTKRVLHNVESDLVYLYELKKNQVSKKQERDDKYAMTKSVATDPYKSSFSTNAIFSIIQGKMADIAAGIQEYDFLPQDADGEKNINVVKSVWAYEWLTTNTDDNIYKAFLSCLKHGDGYIYEGTRKIEREIQCPAGRDENWKNIFVTETKVDWDWIYQEFIPVDEIMHDGTSIADANKVAWIKQWNRDDYITKFSKNANYKNVSEALPIGRHYYISAWQMVLEANTQDDEIVSELRLYNKARDELTILANWVEVMKSPMPYKHKELPFIQAIDVYLDDRVENMWEYELLAEDERFKDAIRALKIDTIKYEAWFTAVDPDADFDWAMVEIGLGKFARVDPKAIAHFAPQINSNNLRDAEQTIDEDIIIKSGQDNRSQVFSWEETNGKLDSKKESSKKRINLMLKQNGSTFFTRLAKLRMSNIQLEYWEGSKKIMIKGGTIGADWVMRTIKGGWGTFTTRPELVKWGFNIIPITDSILWVSNERMLKTKLEFLQVVWDMPKEDPTKILDYNKVVRNLAPSFGIDPDDFIANWEQTKSPEAIMKKMKGDRNGMATDPLDPANPNGIKPEQMSWAKRNVPVIWWLQWQ